MVCGSMLLAASSASTRLLSTPASISTPHDGVPIYEQLPLLPLPNDMKRSFSGTTSEAASMASSVESPVSSGRSKSPGLSSGKIRCLSFCRRRVMRERAFFGQLSCGIEGILPDVWHSRCCRAATGSVAWFAPIVRDR